MYTTRRPRPKPVLWVFIVASLFLAACTGALASGNWPGMSVSDDVVFVAYGPGIIAVDVAERQQLWTFPEESQANLQFFAAPTVADNQLYFGDYGASGGFLSPNITVSFYSLEDFDSSQPVLRWTDSIVATDRIIAPAAQGDGRIFIGTADNKLIALDEEDDARLWEFETEQSIWAAPAYADGVVYVPSLDFSIYALDAESGDELWRFATEGALAGAPALSATHVYVGSFDQNLYAIDRETGIVDWTFRTDGWVWAGPTLSGDTLFITDISGGIFAVDAETGAEMWSAAAPGAIQASPVVTDDRVYIVSAGALTGNVEPETGHVLALDRADGSIIWQRDTMAPLFTTPVIVNESLVVVVQTDTSLLELFNLENGASQWIFLPNEG